MDANKKAMLRNIRQALVVTLVLLLLCGFVFPVLLSGLSGLLFPHQAGGSLVTADGKACLLYTSSTGATFPASVSGKFPTCAAGWAWCSRISALFPR